MQEDFQILNTWNLNARAWIYTIANNGIETRRLVTNSAIVETIVSLRPKKMLDLGCGEGWLVRALQEKLPDTHFSGTDAITELIEAAKKLHPGASFLTHSYESIINGGFKPGHTFDVIAINFALFGNDIVGDLMKTIRLFISSGGHLIIQTLHPHTSNAGEPYNDGWRRGNWNGFSDDFKSPAPWYFRTMESWIRLFTNSGFSIEEIKEPIHPDSLQPASVIFILTVKE